MGKGRAKCFEYIQIELGSSPLVQPYNLTKEATVTIDASEKAKGGVLLQEGSCHKPNKITPILSVRHSQLSLWSQD